MQVIKAPPGKIFKNGAPDSKKFVAQPKKKVKGLWTKKIPGGKGRGAWGVWQYTPTIPSP